MHDFYHFTTCNLGKKHYIIYMTLRFDIGETVSVRVKNQLWPRRKAYAFFISEFEAFTGTVQKPPAWAVDVLSLSTGDSQFPFRLIAYASIVEKNGAVVEPTKTKLQIETWVVSGSKGNSYRVTREVGRWACTCPGFEFRKACKHINDRKLQVA